MSKFQAAPALLRGNSTNFPENCTNCSVSDIEIEPNWFCLILILLPIVCVCGNGLVVMAVLTERTLKTSTNFLLVSLAAADLLVGSLVMPFAVYLTVNNLRWYLPPVMCNFFCVVDVSASTASIVHLVAISIDRFFAVVKQFEYKTAKHQRRVYGTIIFAWVFSISLGLPLGIGLNQGQGIIRADEFGTYECGIVNTYFMLYCSIVGFFVPCIVMIIMYGFVFYQLRKRLRAVKLQEMAAGHMVQFGDNIGNILSNVYGGKDVRQNTMMWAMPFLRTIEATIEEDDSMSSDEIEELTTILHTLESDQRIYKLPEGPEDPLARGRTSRQTASRASNRYGTLEEENLEDEDDDDPFAPPTLRRKKPSRIRRFSQDLRRSFARRQSMYRAKAKIVGLKSRALTLLMKLKNKQGMAIRKETRATKLVSIVMVTFLCCWTPFFAMNLYKVYKMWAGTWNSELEKVFIACTWLGYLNSCLNPFIYSAINRKFRAAFRKILRCPGEERRKKIIRASQPHGLTTQFRSPQLPITTSIGHCPSTGSQLLGLPRAGSSDQGYASTSNFLVEGRAPSLIGHHSPSSNRHGATSPAMLSKRLIRSPSPISEHETPLGSSSDVTKSGERSTIQLEAEVEVERVEEPAESACGLAEDAEESYDLSEARIRSTDCDMPSSSSDVTKPLISPKVDCNDSKLNLDEMSFRNIDSDYITENTSESKESAGLSVVSQETEKCAEDTVIGNGRDRDAESDIAMDELEPMLPIRRIYSGILRETDTEL